MKDERAPISMNSRNVRQTVRQSSLHKTAKKQGRSAARVAGGVLPRLSRRRRGGHQAWLQWARREGVAQSRNGVSILEASGSPVTGLVSWNSSQSSMATLS